MQKKTHKRGPQDDKRARGGKKDEEPRNIAQQTRGMLTSMLLHRMKKNADPTRQVVQKLILESIGAVWKSSTYLARQVT